MKRLGIIALAFIALSCSSQDPHDVTDRPDTPTRPGDHSSTEVQSERELAILADATMQFTSNDLTISYSDLATAFEMRYDGSYRGVRLADGRSFSFCPGAAGEAPTTLQHAVLTIDGNPMAVTEATLLAQRGNVTWYRIVGQQADTAYITIDRAAWPSSPNIQNNLKTE